MQGRPPGSPPAPPAKVDAAIGIVFAVLCAITLVLIRVAVPHEVYDPGVWVTDAQLRRIVDLSLQLIPAVAILFLWFMAALRSRIGTLENQFFSTLYLGSGFLFVAMLFTSGAVARGVLSTFDGGSANLLQDDTYVFARTTAYALTNTFTVKAAAMFMFVSSTIGHRARQMRPHEYVIGYLLGLVLLLVITDATWVFMLFPLWAIVVSVRLRRTETRQELEARATTEAAVEP